MSLQPPCPYLESSWACRHPSDFLHGQEIVFSSQPPPRKPPNPNLPAWTSLRLGCPLLPVAGDGRFVGSLRPLQGWPWGETGGMCPGKAPRQQESLLPVWAPGPRCRRRTSGSCVSSPPALQGQAVAGRGAEGRKNARLLRLRRHGAAQAAMGTSCSLCPELVYSGGN